MMSGKIEITWKDWIEMRHYEKIEYFFFRFNKISCWLFRIQSQQHHVTWTNTTHYIMLHKQHAYNPNNTMLHKQTLLTVEDGVGCTCCFVHVHCSPSWCVRRHIGFGPKLLFQRWFDLEFYQQSSHLQCNNSLSPFYQFF